MWVLTAAESDEPFTFNNPAPLVTNSHFLAFHTIDGDGISRAQVIMNGTLPQVAGNTALVVIPVGQGTVVNKTGSVDGKLLQGTYDSISLIQFARACFPDTVKVARLIEEEDDEDESGSDNNESDEEAGLKQRDEELDRLLRISEKEMELRLNCSNVNHTPPALVTVSELMHQYNFDKTAQMAFASIGNTHVVYCLIPIASNNAQFVLDYSTPLLPMGQGGRPVLVIPTSRIARDLLETSGQTEEETEELVKLSKSDIRIYSLDTKRLEGEHGAGKNPEEMVDDMRRRHASGAFVKMVPPLRTLAQLSQSLAEKYQLRSPPRCIRMRRVVGSMNPSMDVQLYLNIGESKGKR